MVIPRTVFDLFLVKFAVTVAAISVAPPQLLALETKVAILADSTDNPVGL